VKRGNTRDRKTEKPAEETKQNQAIEAEMKKMRREMEEYRQQMRRLKAEQGNKANRTNPENPADSPPPASAFERTRRWSTEGNGAFPPEFKRMLIPPDSSEVGPRLKHSVARFSFWILRNREGVLEVGFLGIGTGGTLPAAWL
jgi:hypothetical protein